MAKSQPVSRKYVTQALFQTLQTNKKNFLKLFVGGFVGSVRANERESREKSSSETARGSGLTTLPINRAYLRNKSVS